MLRVLERMIEGQKLFFTSSSRHKFMSKLGISEELDELPVQHVRTRTEFLSIMIKSQITSTRFEMEKYHQASEDSLQRLKEKLLHFTRRFEQGQSSLLNQFDGVFYELPGTDNASSNRISGMLIGGRRL